MYGMYTLNKAMKTRLPCSKYLLCFIYTYLNKHSELCIMKGEDMEFLPGITECI